MWCEGYWKCDSCGTSEIPKGGWGVIAWRTNYREPFQFHLVTYGSRQLHRTLGSVSHLGKACANTGERDFCYFLFYRAFFLGGGGRKV